MYDLPSPLHTYQSQKKIESSYSFIEHRELTLSYRVDAVLKTESQFGSKQLGGKPPGLVQITKTTFARHGIKGFYSGVGALVAGNSMKAGVRFFSYDKFKKMLVDGEVRSFSVLS